jgi:hypothetical protein
MNHTELQISLNMTLEAQERKRSRNLLVAATNLVEVVEEGSGINGLPE